MPGPRKRTAGLGERRRLARDISESGAQTYPQAMRNLSSMRQQYRREYARSVTLAPSAGTYGNQITPTMAPTATPVRTQEPEYSGGFPLIHKIYAAVYDALNRRPRR